MVSPLALESEAYLAVSLSGVYLVLRNRYEASELIFVAGLSVVTGTTVQSLLQYLLKPRLDRREFDKDLDELDTLHKNGRINKKTYPGRRP